MFHQVKQLVLEDHLHLAHMINLLNFHHRYCHRSSLQKLKIELPRNNAYSPPIVIYDHMKLEQQTITERMPNQADIMVISPHLKWAIVQAMSVTAIMIHISIRT